METNSIPQLEQVLKINEALLGLPALPLVLLLSIALGYVLKFIPRYPNNWIPIGVIMGAILANVGIAHSDGSGNYIRAIIYGLIVGVASIAIHRKWLKDWLDPKMFGVLLITLMLPFCFTGCASIYGGKEPTREAVVYYTFRDTWSAAHSAYQGYCDLVVQGRVSKSDEADVDKAWNDFRSKFKAALLAANSNWSAATPESVVLLKNDVITLIRAL